MSTTQMISVSLIDPPTWNSRLEKDGAQSKAEDAKIAQMAAEFMDPKIGQLQPIEVEAKEDGRFELVIGSRRLKAAKLNASKEIWAEVRPVTTPADRIGRNIAENMDREPLTTFETARASAELAALGLKNPEIAPKVKVSSTHVSNLRTAYTGLPEPILKDWRHNHPAATVDNLTSIARGGKDDEAKLMMWDALVQEAAEKEAAGQKPGKRGKGKDKDEGKGGTAGYPVSQKRVAYLLKVLASKTETPELGDDVRMWGLSIVKYLVQARESVSGVPKMPTKKSGKAKAAKEGDK